MSSYRLPLWVWSLLVPGILVILPGQLIAQSLDFSAAFQDLEAGEILDVVELPSGATMKLLCDNGGSGPDLCIVFDSSEPIGDSVDLGTPNEDFGGPGQGSGGEAGAEGENRDALGNLVVIADNGEDEDGDGRVDDPEDEGAGGVVRLEFSHVGTLSLALVDVDHDEEEPRFKLFKHGTLLEVVEGSSPGNNSVQHFDFSDHGEIDAVEIHLGGGAGIASIVLDVITVSVESKTWSKVKNLYGSTTR